MEAALIPLDSPLRHLPVGLSHNQLVTFDGLRHAAEIAGLAHERLKGVLAQLAHGADEAQLTTAAYLDAWAIVDSVHRFHALLLLVPTDGSATAEEYRARFSAKTESLRLARNVADHLATRIAYVLAHKGASLGTLTWIVSTAPGSALMCSLVPGSTRSTRHNMPNPGGQHVEAPVGFIHLAAGEHITNLSSVMVGMSDCVARLTTSVESVVNANGVTERHGSDLIIRMAITFDAPSA
jgi:hypothetical protein